MEDRRTGRVRLRTGWSRTISRKDAKEEHCHFELRTQHFVEEER